MTQEQRDTARLHSLAQQRQDGAFWTANDEEQFQALCKTLKVNPNRFPAMGSDPRPRDRQ